MLYAIKLGPLETGEGHVNAYIGVRDDGFLARPVIGRSDKDALRMLAADSDPGESLLCEKRLARVGAAFGFEAAAMPAWVPLPRAVFATALALGPLLRPGDPSALHLLCHGAAEFWRAKPWQHWTDQEPIEVALTGSWETKFEAAVMGASGEEYGVALYRRAGALSRIARNVERNQILAAALEDGLVVTLDGQPRFAVKAIEDTYGLDRVPTPVKIERGAASPVDSREVAVLGTVLRLLATVTPDHREAAAMVGCEDDEIEVVIRMPPLRA